MTPKNSLIALSLSLLGRQFRLYRDEEISGDGVPFIALEDNRGNLCASRPASVLADSSVLAPFESEAVRLIAFRGDSEGEKAQCRAYLGTILALLREIWL